MKIPPQKLVESLKSHREFQKGKEQLVVKKANPFLVFLTALFVSLFSK